MKAKFFTKGLVFLIAVIVLSGTLFAADAQKAKQYLDYGNKYLSAKQYDNAIKYYQYSLKLNPTDSGYYALGMAYYYKGQKPEALNSFQYALKTNPNNANAKKMVDYLQKSVGGGGGGNTQAQQYLAAGTKYLNAKQYDYAIKYYEASIKIEPTYQAYQYLGTAYYYKGDNDKAIEAFNNSLKLNPDNPAVKGVLAKLGAGGGTTEQPRISSQMGVHPLLLAAIFAGAIAALFLF